MVAAWPAKVTTRALAGTLSGQGEDARIDFKPEVGPPLRRRRSSVTGELLKFDSHMNAAEYDALDAFYSETLRHGTLPFTREHPRTGATEIFSFEERPSYQDVNGKGLFRVSISLRLMP